MDKEKLLKIIEDDTLNLLDLKRQASSIGTEDDRLIASFSEINNFITEYKREPQANPNNIQEYKLFKRLESLRHDSGKMQVLTHLDNHNLFKNVNKIENLKDVFKDDDLGILEDESDDIFKLTNVPVKKGTIDYVAVRKPCKNFNEFEHLFKACHADLRFGKRKLLRFSKGEQINIGSFFILFGVMVYVQHVGQKKKTKHGDTNARLRCIFENGTESDMLLRSLSRGLYSGGRRVSDNIDKLRDIFKVDEKDVSTGYVYVLKSLSNRPDIQSIKNLYKIGFSTIPVEDRIKNASIDPTFLMSQVQIVTTFQCYNLNPSKLENLLHRFFGKACIEIEAIDNEGRKHIPREWFAAPLSIIEQAITLLINGEIINYRYDHVKEDILIKESFNESDSK